VSDHSAGVGPTQRLAELGVTLPEAPAPAAAYVGHVVHGGMIHTAQRCARQCAVNVLAQVAASGRRLENVRRIVKLTVFVASAPGFIDQHLVANGASEFLGDVFGDVGRHARSAVGVALLPLGSPVEIEALIAVDG
jgi:enamine deaminase RidA (YjgF/YER057c/UK114 family)